MFLCYRKIEIFKIFSEIEMKPKRQLFRIIITISYFVIFVTRKKIQVFVMLNRHVKKREFEKLSFYFNHSLESL